MESIVHFSLNLRENLSEMGRKTPAVFQFVDWETGYCLRLNKKVESKRKGVMMLLNQLAAIFYIDARDEKREETVKHLKSL